MPDPPVPWKMALIKENRNKNHNKTKTRRRRGRLEDSSLKKNTHTHTHTQQLIHQRILPGFCSITGFLSYEETFWMFRAQPILHCFSCFLLFTSPCHPSLWIECSTISREMLYSLQNAPADGASCCSRRLWLYLNSSRTLAPKYKINERLRKLYLSPH